jgi:hypothetical protein
MDTMQTTADGVTGVAVPAEAPVVIAEAPPDPSRPPDHFVWRYFISMVMEIKDGAWGLSIGRVLLLALFTHALVVWSWGHDIPDHELDTLAGLLAYVLGSKIVGAVQAWKQQP